jgi:hypothetical protein
MFLSGIKATEQQMSEIYVLRFNGDLYSMSPSKLIDTDVVDINTNCYIKHTQIIYRVYCYDTAAVVLLNDSDIKISSDEEFRSIKRHKNYLYISGKNIVYYVNTVTQTCEKILFAHKIKQIDNFTSGIYITVLLDNGTLILLNANNQTIICDIDNVTWQCGNIVQITARPLRQSPFGAYLY